ncbi:hypothetical protein JCM30471_28750 [Desulfuromonas carbonis]|uniref:hypothetical protein n=1 Tax=Desulfuromonas sp. DDH964 TaxID=1823759 RepID=UPI00078D18D1|nr:hypothetical protein [Desulfuromonas sp. DDH964]AMV71056.1 hypothetical protein DBW_0665 [Desulfuromonas sp. DDH964]
MAKISRYGLLLVLFGLFLGGCSWMAVPRPDVADAERDFSTRLRWLDFPGAARHLRPEYQEAFREQFAALDGLHITDTRFVSRDETASGQIDSRLEIDYYRLPSVTVRTWQFTLAWEYVDLGRWQSGYWRIATPFPDFP